MRRAGRGAEEDGEQREGKKRKKGVGGRGESDGDGLRARGGPRRAIRGVPEEVWPRPPGSSLPGRQVLTSTDRTSDDRQGHDQRQEQAGGRSNFRPQRSSFCSGRTVLNGTPAQNPEQSLQSAISSLPAAPRRSTASKINQAALKRLFYVSDTSFISYLTLNLIPLTFYFDSMFI